MYQQCAYSLWALHFYLRLTYVLAQLSPLSEESWEEQIPNYMDFLPPLGSFRGK